MKSLIQPVFLSHVCDKKMFRISIHHQT